jgi:hypothetical protein
MSSYTIYKEKDGVLRSLVGNQQLLDFSFIVTGELLVDVYLILSSSSFFCFFPGYFILFSCALWRVVKQEEDDSFIVLGPLSVSLSEWGNKYSK